MPSTYEGQLQTQRGHDFSTFTVRDVDPRVHLLQSEIAPIATILLNLAKERESNSTKHEWIEDEILPHVTAVNNVSGYLSTDKTFIVDNEEYGNVGAFVLVQRTREIMGTVDSKDSGASTITVAKRGCFGTSAAALVDNDVLIFLRGNIRDGGDAAESIQTLPVNKYNYIEPTSTTWNVSDMLEKMATYGGVNKLAYLRAKKMKEHMEELEKKIIYGIRGLDTSVDTGVRYSMGGLLYWITSTVTTIAVGTGNTKGFTLKQWNSWMRDLFQYNDSSAEKIVFASGDVIEQIDDFKLQQTDMRPDDMMINVACKSVKNSFGTVHLVHHRMLNENFGTDWYAIAIDPAKVAYVPYEAQMVRTAIQEKRKHSREDEIYESGTLKVMTEPVHGIFKVTE